MSAFVFYGRDDHSARVLRGSLGKCIDGLQKAFEEPGGHYGTLFVRRPAMPTLRAHARDDWQSFLDAAIPVLQEGLRPSDADLEVDSWH